ncbi:MAG: choice-of-anchor tandem repeat GloVer-containing protein [Candidatus Sulfotelmatobacter sp.]
MQNNSRIGITLATVAFLLIVARGVQAQAEKVIYSFAGGSDGGSPNGVVIDAKGNLYGTAAAGGSGSGTLFELAPNGNGTWTETVLHTFSSDGIDGVRPDSGLVFDSSGNLYGTTSAGGQYGLGTIYELSPGSNGTSTEQILYSFGGNTDAVPLGGGALAIDGSGNLYGSSDPGGAYGFGTVFELIRGSNGTWKEAILHSFSGDNDGSQPESDTLILDHAGNVYGMANGGGPHDYGLIFELSPESNGTWTEKTVHAFAGSSDGGGPIGGVIFNASGDLFGAAYSAFELTPGSNGIWTKKALYTFTGGSDGAYPSAPLVFDKAGNLYGTTDYGGNHHGTVFELSPNSNGTWTERVLHRFSTTAGDGYYPQIAPLVMDAKGNLYGTTGFGGASGAGVVYEVKP